MDRRLPHDHARYQFRILGPHLSRSANQLERNYEAPIFSSAAGASFKDMWTLHDVDVHEQGELANRNPAAYSVIEAARQAHGKGIQS